MQTRLKVYAYITWQGRLLVFRHTQFPEAGLQVPGGSVEMGEFLEAAAHREAEEETGLHGLRTVEYLGEQEVQGGQWRNDELQIRHFYLLEPGPLTFPGGITPERWIHYETTPSDGSPGPIEFEFFWVRRDKKPPHHFMVELAADMGAKLHLLY